MNGVRAAYSARAGEYVDLLGRIENTAEPDRRLILEWARSLSGLMLDVGCGPGQWTNHLRAAGIAVEGIDPVAAFIDSARATYPDSAYRVGSAENLGVESGRLGGILAWYSLIHTEPEAIDIPLAEFGRCLRPGGGLALGFFTSAEITPFDHAVTTAYSWPVDELARRVEKAGFDIEHTETRILSDTRTHAAITAGRRTR